LTFSLGFILVWAMRFALMLVLGALVLVGCRHSQAVDGSSTEAQPKSPWWKFGAAKEETPAPAPPPRITPLDEVTGKVASVVPSSGFVVIDFAYSRLPQVGQTFNVYRQGQKVAELKISGPARDMNIVADIVAGDVQVGDEARDN